MDTLSVNYINVIIGNEGVMNITLQGLSEIIIKMTILKKFHWEHFNINVTT
jgi:hypothetical protein